MNPFNPFSKALKDLTASDLRRLREVKEGWYIEYKQEIPNADAIAKSLSAFANTYGGYLFYGVGEESKGNPVASTFPGVATTDALVLVDKIRQAAAHHVNPAPFFNYVILSGPCQEVGLHEGRCVICIHVPWSADAPHVHRRGQVYRRVADGSEPHAEQDRFALDQLFRRSDRQREACKKWVNRELELPQEDSGRPIVRVLIMPDKWGDRNVFFEGSIEDVRSVLGRGDSVFAGIVFDSVHETSHGFVARPILGQEPSQLGLVWRLNRSLVSEIVIPLNFWGGIYSTEAHDASKNYKFIKRYFDILERQRLDKEKIVDLSGLFIVMIAILEKMLRIFDLSQADRRFVVKMKFLNVWHTAPFIDVESVVDAFEEHGVPFSLRKDLLSPSGEDPDSFEPSVPEEWPDRTGENLFKSVLIGHSLTIAKLIALAFGVQLRVRDIKEISELFADYYEAGRRAHTEQGRS